MTVYQILKSSDQKLEPYFTGNTIHQAEMIVSRVLGLNRSQLYLQRERQMSQKEINTIQEYVDRLRKELPHLIICGDYNICHRAIDIHDPKRNAQSSGFLPEERAWMEQWFSNGMIDSFRAIHGDKPDHYTWWSYRANARVNNKGWRIDYVSITENMQDKLVGAEIRPLAVHSDHCPSYAILDI